MRYKLVVEFDCEEDLKVITSQIKKYIGNAIPNECILNCIVDDESIEVISPEETITLPMEEYEELVKCSNYVFHWGNRVTTCKRCGNFNPSHCICASCGYDGSDD